MDNAESAKIGEGGKERWRSRYDFIFEELRLAYTAILLLDVSDESYDEEYKSLCGRITAEKHAIDYFAPGAFQENNENKIKELTSAVEEFIAKIHEKYPSGKTSKPN